MRSAALLALPAVVIVGLLAGCSGTSTSTSNGTISSGTPSAAAAAASSSPSTAAEANPKFGQTYTFKSGLQVSISAPEAFTPSEYASGAGASNVKYTVTIVNGTKDTLSPIAIQFTATANGQAGSAIEDSDNGVSSFPSASTVATGATTSWTMGYGFANAAGMTLEVDPNDFTSKAVTFTS